MGAITKRNQGIRHLRKHITHIQLTFDFDQQCREVVTECIPVRQGAIPHGGESEKVFGREDNI